jgi:hypothetical protein
MNEILGAVFSFVVLFAFLVGVLPHPIRFHREGMERIRRDF